MRILRYGLAALVILPTAGCFQSSTVIRVKADGSGTIQQPLLLTEQALDQLRAFTILGGGHAERPDPPSEAQARALAAAIRTAGAQVPSMPVASGLSPGPGSRSAFGATTQPRVR